MLSVLLIPLLGLVSYWLTGRFIAYAHAHRLLDVPNARSSHVRVTPRGGGVVFVVLFLLGLGLLHWQGVLPAALTWGLGGAGALIAAVGFADDHRHIPARWRLLAHFAAAFWLLGWLGVPPLLAGFGLTLDSSVLDALLLAVLLAWLINLYNFMDGIDGIAGGEALCFCLGGSLCCVCFGAWPLCGVLVLLAVCVTGFLRWNWPPAQVFMGDVGSACLGVLVGGVLLAAGQVSMALFAAFLILLGVFVVDASCTLAVRLLRRQRVYEAHRSHAYQRASRRLGGHAVVSRAVVLINAFWLLPWALLVALEAVMPLTGLFWAYAPLLLLCLALGAGRADASGA